MSRRVKVLAVMGSGRAGSTLLDTLLGSVDGFFSAGELRYLWSVDEDAPRCGCGSDLATCPIWQAVVGGSGGRPDDSLRSDVRRWQNELGRTRHTASLLRAERSRTRRTDLREYVAAMNELYLRIAEVAGASVIVDSSKRPSDAALLRLLPDVDPYVVHLVRDPRAVAYSWQRTKRDPGSARAGDDRMPTRSALRSTAVWVELNAVGHLVRGRFGQERSRFVRYEDFVRHPRSAIAEILELVGEEGDLPVGVDGAADLAPNHTVGGNPNRFARGRVVVRPDDAWKAELAASDGWLCSALAAPLNLAYGYPIAPPWPARSRADQVTAARPVERPS